LWKEVERVYRELGGVLPTCPLRVGPWDIEVGDVALELDEEQHFNRYRAVTLGSSAYDVIPNFPLVSYRQFCKLHESDCSVKCAAGERYWVSTGATKQFGLGSFRGDLNPPGAPRWKQRAFFDFLKDLAPAITGTRVARISIWDAVLVQSRRFTLAEIFDGRCGYDAVPAILGLIENRCGGRLG